MNRTTARRASAIATLIALMASTTSVAVAASSADAAPATTGATAKTAAATTSWFHDPVSKKARNAQVAVPKNPSKSTGKLRHTAATYKTRAGAIAVPVSWAKGHDLAKGQAVVLNKSGLFTFDKATPTKTAKSQIKKLNASMDVVTAVRCEGYTDYAGSKSHEKALSKKRAVAICKLVDAAKKSISVTSVGYGGTRPVVVGSTASKRTENRRVIIVVTKTKAATPKPTPTPTPTPVPVRNAPGAPTLQSATAGNSSASVSFAAPSSDGGSAITKYQVTVNGGTTWFDLTTSGSGPITATIGPIVNGDTYPVRVRAVNAVGAGDPSNTVSVTPVAVPSAPVLATATRGDTTAAIAFAPPTTTGGSAVTSYQASTDGGTTWTTITTTGTTSLTASLTGLTNGMTYPVTVRAVSAIGNSLPSNSVNVTPATTPGAPTLASTTPSNGGASVSFSAPASNGGSAVTSYQVSTDNGATWTTVTTTGTGPITASVTGLTNGTTYQVKVRAVNTVGNGPASNAVAVTPATVAGAPNLTAANRGDASAAITFAAPSTTGGSAITGYEASTNGGTSWTALTTAGTGPYTATITGLTNGTTYPVTVRAVNATGNSVASNSLNVTPATVPSAPTLSSATPGSGSLALTFTAPTSNGGSAITSYEVTTNGTTWATLTTTGTGPITATVTGLTNGTAYPVQVRAVNAIGNGAPSNTISSTPRTIPGAPTVSTVSPGDQQLVVVFAAPSSNGGSAVTGYETSTDSGTTWVAATTTGTGPFTATITGLTNGTAYPVTVRAVNAAGAGATSNAISGTPRTVPTAPTLSSATPGDGEADLTFSLPDNGGSPITSYEGTNDGGTTWTTLTDVTGTDPITATYPGLANGTVHFVAVRAVNAAGPGPTSNAVAVSPESPVPSEIELVSATATYDGGFTQAYADLVFTTPTDDGSSPITGYQYTTNDGDTWFDLTPYTPGDPNTARVLVDWDCDSVTLTFAVRAVNANGGGPISNSKSASWFAC